MWPRYSVSRIQYSSAAGLRMHNPVNAAIANGYNRKSFYAAAPPPPMTMMQHSQSYFEKCAMWRHRRRQLPVWSTFASCEVLVDVTTWNQVSARRVPASLWVKDGKDCTAL